MLLNRALQPYFFRQTEFRPKVSLLVSLSPLGDSRAIIGFNALARKNLKLSIIKERKEHLSALENVESHEMPWLVGNCAESETFRTYPGNIFPVHESVAQVDCGDVDTRYH